MAVTQAWSYTAGEKGRNRVRVFERPGSGILVLEFKDDGRKARQSLGHRDRERAKGQADQLAAALRRPTRDGRCTWQELFDSYLRDVTATKDPKRQAEEIRWAGWILQFVGPQRRIEELRHADLRRYVAHRRRLGDQRRAEGSHGKPIGTRGLQQQVGFWRAVVAWGIGEGLCLGNPLVGFRVPTEGTPHRPRVTPDRYAALLAVADQVGGGPAPTLFHLMLGLANETGHRRGAIRQLRRSDVDLEAGLVSWRDAGDKIAFAHVTPLSPAAVALLAARFRAVPTIGDGWLFPSPRRPGRPLEDSIFVRWWRKAVEKAGLPTITGEGYHAFRRKFATELKGVPLADLAQLGGWKSSQTILKCYTQPDEDTMRQALQRRVAIS